MPNSIQALGVFLILLPGFTCAYIVQQLAVRPKQTELDKVIEALLLSFVLYLCIGPFFGFALPVGWHPTSTGGLQNYGIAVAWRELVALALGALGLGIFYSASVNHDWILTLLRKTHVTERTSRTSIWGDVFQELGGTVQVGLADGRMVTGWVRYYSDDVNDAAVFLEKAKWVDHNGSDIPVDGPGILLLPKSGIQYVMFLKNETTEISGASQD